MTLPMSRVCAGHSMTPTVRLGDTVRITTGVRPVPGDAVLFSSPRGDYDVLHRLVFKLPLLPYFVHRGDAPTASVGLARWERIVGCAELPRRRPMPRDYYDGLALVATRARTQFARVLRAFVA
jgi:hypothetical protein